MAQGERLADEAVMQALDSILRRMIVRSFPKLRRLAIAIRWGVETDDLLQYIVQGGTHLIRVNDTLRHAPRNAIEGGLAHELCHIDADMAMGRFQRALAWERYARSLWFRTREERATELRVIQIGYGPHLLAFVRFARRLGYSFEREHGLLYGEILQLSTSWAGPAHRRTAYSPVYPPRHFAP